ncbi:hypothetical protein QQ045_001200 [Rhodiola kirilowii]
MVRAERGAPATARPTVSWIQLYSTSKRFWDAQSSRGTTGLIRSRGWTYLSQIASIEGPLLIMRIFSTNSGNNVLGKDQFVWTHHIDPRYHPELSTDRCRPVRDRPESLAAAARRTKARAPQRAP